VEKLFGIPIDQLTVILLAVFGLGVAGMSLVALRSPVTFKLGVRNIPRRRSQTALIVLGLMLATVLFSAAFSAGDTLTHSIRALVLKDLGEVDLAVRAEIHETNGQPKFFGLGTFETVRQALADNPNVEGVAPLVRAYAPVVAPVARLSEPWVPILGLDEQWMGGFDRLKQENGNSLSTGALAPHQVYISRALASEINVEEGDAVLLFLGTEPTRLQVVGVYDNGAHPAGKFSMVTPMAQLQALTGHEGQITEVLISNRGDAMQGVKYSDAVLSELGPILEGTGLKAEPLKKDALERAETDGSTIAGAFFLFAQFSIASGVMLIFLLFVMLAAERKRELGISRAVGTQRSHLIQMFSFEGAMYSLLAAAIGSLLGVGVGLAMVRIMGIAMGQWNVELVFAFRWRSLVIAYTLGMALTFAVVLISSWRVSRLNIVRAVRDLPEPTIRRRSWKGPVFAILLTLVGALLAYQGYQSKQATPFGLGVSIVVIGVPLLARWLGFPDRAAFSAAGLGLVLWWLLPGSFFGLPDMQKGLDLFLISGIMLVLGAVLTVMYNSELLLAVLVRLLGRVRGLAPVIKTAMTCPMQNRLRTGITLAMFSLIVFTLIMMAFIIAGNDSVYENTERISGGYHVRARINPLNPVPDIRAALQETDGVNPDDVEAIASLAWAQARVKQEGSDKEPVDWWIRGHDDGYADSVTYEFALKADGYSSSRQVWQALQTQLGTAVVDAYMVPSKTDFSIGEYVPDFQLQGVYLEDDALPEIYILVQDPRTENEQRLRVIGVLNSGSFYGAGVMVSQQTLNSLVSDDVQPEEYMFRLKKGVDAEAAAKALEAGFLEHGLQGTALATEIRENAGASQLMNTLLEGFMGLGLVVGIAALGVIAARSVVERRKQIGILRALGFQKEMVQLTFLLESSFVALLGISIGVILGTLLSYSVINEMGKDIEGLAYRVPWLNIILVIVIAYGASLLTTFLPARQAAKVYPAEALRFE
jgi:putative ABC transport system permease protein